MNTNDISGEPLAAPGTTEPLDLDALKALSDAATPGPWSADETGTVCADVDLEPDGAGGEILPEGGPAEVAECYRNERTGERAANAAFIAAARTALPQALAEIERLRAEPAEARLNPGHEINLTCGHCRRRPATYVIVAFLPPPIGRNTEIVCGDCAEYGMEMISTICHTIQACPVVFARPERRPTGVHR